MERRRSAEDCNSPADVWQLAGAAYTVIRLGLLARRKPRPGHVQSHEYPDPCTDNVRACMVLPHPAFDRRHSRATCPMGGPRPCIGVGTSPPASVLRAV